MNPLDKISDSLKDDMTNLDLISICVKCYEMGLRDACSQLGVDYSLNTELFEARIFEEINKN